MDMLGYLKLKKKIKSKLMSLRIGGEKLLEKYKGIWNKIEDIKNIESNALPVYDDRYIKTKIRRYGDKIYTNFRDLNVPKDDKKCESFTVISIDSLLVYKNKYYLEVHLDNCAYKVIDKQMILMKISLKFKSYKCSITKELI